MGHDRAVLVTGASRGIGRGIACALAAAGWRVGVNYRENGGAAAEVVAAIHGAGGTAQAVQGDVAEGADRSRMLTFMLEAFGRLDALINNAGVAPEARVDVLEASEASYDRVLDINLKAPFLLTQQAARTMLEQIREKRIDEGYIVNISSVSAYTASTNRGEYCISKAGLSMLTQVFAARLAGEHIHVHEVRPGVIATDMTAGAKEKYDALLQEGLTPLPRWGQPEDVGKCVAAILGGAFPYSAGQVFDVDGGFHLRRL